MSRCKNISSICLLVLFFSSNAYCEPKEYIRVDSYGLAFVVDGNTAQARDDALRDGFKRAVEDAIKIRGFKIDVKKNSMLKDKILSNADAYIANFKIISEEITEEKIEGEEKPFLVYNISIEANIDGDILKNDLIRFELIKDDAEEIRKIYIALIDVFEYKDFLKLKDAIKGLKGVKNLSYKTFSRGRIILAIESTADKTAIKEELVSKEFSGFKIEIDEKGDGEVDLIIKKGGQLGDG